MLFHVTLEEECYTVLLGIIPEASYIRVWIERKSVPLYLYPTGLSGMHWN